MFKDSILSWHRSIHSIISSRGRAEQRYEGLGTTLVALLCYAQNFYWLNCGDSRLYRLHAGELTQVTTDHSPKDPNGMGGHTNLITNCIGGGCQTSFIDIVPCNELVEPGDTLMLCSDGLNDMISDTEICNLLKQGLDANDLCLAAEAAGGYDNVSVVVIRIE
jgi:protein phosphatase